MNVFNKIITILAFLFISINARSQSCESPTLDGYTYEVVQIAGKCWFAENLKTSLFANGDAIPTVQESSFYPWSNTEGFANPYQTTYGEVNEFGCGMFNDPYTTPCDNTVEQNSNQWGRLYNWAATMDDRNICPSGWRVSTTVDWKDMETSLLGIECVTTPGFTTCEWEFDFTTFVDETDPGQNALDYLTSISTSTVGPYGTGFVGTDDFGFKSIPAGWLYAHGPTGGQQTTYGQNGLMNYYWVYGPELMGDGTARIPYKAFGQIFDLQGVSAYAFNPVDAYITVSGNNFSDLTTLNDDYGLAVRCVKDVDTGCIDPDACNYDEFATVDDGSCEYPSYPICDCDGNGPALGCGYDCEGNPFCLADTDGDGVCDECEIPGCYDPTACNYNPEATDNDGSCDFTTCYGCTDPLACNYDETATINEGCEYPEVGYECDCSLQTCWGDFNLDGSVTTADFLLLLGVFGVPCSEINE